MSAQFRFRLLPAFLTTIVSLYGAIGFRLQGIMNTTFPAA